MNKMTKPLVKGINEFLIERLFNLPGASTCGLDCSCCAFLSRDAQEADS